MTLSRPVARKQIHTREITCKGYEREDGQWDIEAEMTDTKTYSFENTDRGIIASGEPIHQMQVRLTVNENLEVTDAEAVTIQGPFNICGNITDSYKQLIGLKVGPGWKKSIFSRLGQTKGCTHLSDLLLGSMPVIVFQTIRAARDNRHGKNDPAKKPAIMDTCHAMASDSVVTKKLWPDFFTGTETAPKP